MLHQNKDGSVTPGVVVEGSQDPTYSIAFNGLVPVASCTDLVTIQGVAGKVIRIKHAQLSGIATSGTTVEVSAIRRTSQNTGGTSTNPTPVAHDPADPASKAVAALYTANPSALGSTTGGGAVHSDRMGIGTAASVNIQEQTWMFDNKDIVLRGPNDVFALNLNGQTVGAGGSLAGDVTWTEVDAAAGN